MKYKYQNKLSGFILDCPEFNKPKLKHIKINGFTLIEVIIAIAIFSILALGANALLVNVTNSNEISAQRAQQLEELQRAMMIIERDFLQMQQRVPRTQGIENNLVINGGEFEFESDDYGIGFVRGGVAKPSAKIKT